MKKVDHIGIAVKDGLQAKKFYELLLGVACEKIEIVASEKVKAYFFNAGNTHIELLEGTSPDSVISKFIEKKGEGIHHIAYKVGDIKKEITKLINQGYDVLYNPPKIGANNKLVTFVHPKNTNGVLIELCEDRSYPSS